MALDDVTAVLAVEREAYAYPWTRRIFEDCLRVGYCCWLAEEAGRLAGYGIMSVAVEECHILNLCVDPTRRRRGIGRRLLAHLLDLARRRGARTAFLEVRQSNGAAMALYRHAGFNEVGRRRGYYPAPGGREDAVVLARELGEGAP